MGVKTEPRSGDLRRYYREIYRYVRRRSLSDADAEDVTQEVFADAARALGALNYEEKAPIAWLYTVAQRRLVDRARTLARRQEVGADGLELVTATPPEYGPELATAIRAAIDQLPRSQRRVVVMKLVQGRPFAEIAASLNASEGACRMRFLRGLEQLRAYLESEEMSP